jgi:hypothetical protein
MRTPNFRHIAAIGALALIAVAPVAACGAEPLKPLPVQAAGPEPAATVSLGPADRPSTPTSTGSSPPRVAQAPAAPGPVRTTKTPRPDPTPSACFGAIRYDLNLQETELALIKSMCFHTGGVLRLQGIGPGLVTATPESLRSQSYEAGVVDIRFVRPGTVTVTIPQDEQTYTITVVVVG